MAYMGVGQCLECGFDSESDEAQKDKIKELEEKLKLAEELSNINMNLKMENYKLKDKIKKLEYQIQKKGRKKEMKKDKEKYYEVKYKRVITYRVVGKGTPNGYTLNWIGDDDLNIDADMGRGIETISPIEEYDIESVTQEEDQDAIISREISEEDAIKLSKEIEEESKWKKKLEKE